MFFSISRNVDSRFPFSHNLGHWIFNHDAGWTQGPDRWYKGYRWMDISHGNFCEVALRDNDIHLVHDRERSFPLWWNPEQEILTNCIGSGQQIWTAEKVILSQNDVHIIKQDVIGDIDLEAISLDSACHTIKHDLVGKFRRLQKESVSKKIFVSGGVDTVALFSLVRSLDIQCESVGYEYFHYDHFTNHFIKQIRQQHWAYQQIHHWCEPCYLITGACGDEYLFRGPNLIAIWLAWHDIDFLDVLTKTSGYHKHYFMLEKNQSLFRYHFENRKKLQKRYPEKHYITRYLIDINLNDHQHWHLGHTLTWTPYKDIEIFKLLLRVDVEEMMAQFIDAKMSRGLIDLDFMSLLSEQKNYLARQNLDQISIS